MIIIRQFVRCIAPEVAAPTSQTLQLSERELSISCISSSACLSDPSADVNTRKCGKSNLQLMSFLNEISRMLRLWIRFQEKFQFLSLVALLIVPVSSNNIYLRGFNKVMSVDSSSTSKLNFSNTLHFILQTFSVTSVIWESSILQFPGNL